MMIVTWWGVRGSVPVPGSATVRYGGNTSCVAIRRGSSLLVIDAGTGIIPLGERLDPSVSEVLLLLTHRHADHVQGLPFFAPLHATGMEVGLLDLPLGDGVWSPLELFDGVSVPLRPERLAASVRRIGGEPLAVLRERGWVVERLALVHPGGAWGYRVGGFAHLTDTELGADPAFFARCVELCRGAAVLSHDAQFLEGEEGARGRGHSTVERACELAEAAAVGRLVLFHHDPGREDHALDRIGEYAAERLRGSGVECVVAREGLEIVIP